VIIIKAYKAKYIHIFFRNELKFNGRVIQMINDQSNDFNPKDHLFVTSYQDVYDELVANYKNIEIAPKGINLLNEYASQCKWIIAHSFDNINTVLKANKSALKKTIYRYWGGAISGFQYEKGNVLKNIAKLIVNVFYRSKIKNLAGIGIANTVDVIDIRKTFKDIPLFKVPYAIVGNFASLEKTKSSSKRTDGVVKVLLGHRGGQEENHIQLLKTLSKFDNEKMEIYIPLSYGDKSYIEEIKQYIVDNNLLNVKVLDQFMPYADYGKLLNDMDVAIFNGKTSYALGNIAMLLYLKKKIFLNPGGIIREAFDYENTPYCTIDQIDNMDFASFAKPVYFADGVGDALMVQNMEYNLKRWDDLLKAYN
jgi:hypothetical protein